MEKKNKGVSLYQLTEEYNELLDLLEDEEGNEEEIKKLLAELEKNLDNKFDGYMRVYYNLEACEEAVAKEVKRLTERKKKFERKKERIKESLLVCMRTTGRQNINTEFFSASLKATPEKVIVDDEALIPREFFKPQPDTLDKKSLLSYLKEHKNENLEYAHLEKGQTIILK